jgi:hypothetical protein
MAVDHIARTMALLRRQMADNLDVLRRAGKLGVATGGNAAPRASPQNVREAVRQRLRALDPADPRHAAKATRVFVESVLVAEFGDSLINDPKFRELIDDVAATMLADTALAGALRALAAQAHSG